MATARLRDILSEAFSPPFLLALALLGAAALLAGPASPWKHVRQEKEHLPLQRPLGDLSDDAVAPYRVRKRRVLPPIMVEALGTTEYIDWALEDASVPEGDPLRLANLLITYYSGGNSLVPHTPDQCYLGSGYMAAQSHENTEIRVPQLGMGGEAVPIRVCTFIRTAVFKSAKTSVIYTFHANGRFVATAWDVRLLTHNPTETYAYFSKVEVSFPRATREQSIEGAAKLFERLLPTLIRDHWPDFQGAERAAREASASASARTAAPSYRIPRDAASIRIENGQT